MLCRQEKRKQYFKKIITIAEKEDKAGWFQEKCELEEYKRIIKNPMYFSLMKENLDLYIANVQLFKDHFDLVFKNAFNYNNPKHKAYRDAEKVQAIVNKVMERKWDKLIEKQDMTIEERDHEDWVQKQIEFDPDFLEKSEDVEVPPKKFKYVPHKAKQDNEEMVNFINEPEIAASSNKSPNDSDNDSSVFSSKLRKRKKNTKYTEPDNFTSFSNDGKGALIKPQIAESSKSSTKRGIGGKPKKNPDIHFSSDEEMEDVKNMTLQDIDFSDPQSCTAKKLLEKPDELEGLDVKQYYNNPVRCSFDNPTLAFVPMCFLCGSFGNEEEFIFCNL